MLTEAQRATTPHSDPLPQGEREKDAHVRVIVGERQSDRERLLLRHLETVYDPTTRELNALLLVPTPRRAQTLREAVLTHFGRKCWTPNVETFESLVRRRAADVGYDARLMDDEARLLLIQELLPDSGIVRVPNARSARRIAEALDIIGGEQVEETRHATEVVLERLPEFAHHAQRLATLYHRYRDTLKARRLLDGTRLAVELARRWASTLPSPTEGGEIKAFLPPAVGEGRVGGLLVLDEFVTPEPLHLAIAQALRCAYDETIITIAANPENCQLLTANCQLTRGYAALGTYYDWIWEQSPEVIVAEGEGGQGLPQEVSRRLFDRISDDLKAEEDSEAVFRILTLNSRRAEARTVARLIRRRLGEAPPSPSMGEAREGVMDFRRFTVVVPNWGDYQGLLVETFEEYGLPANFARGIPLSSVPAMRLLHKALTSLTDASDGWTMESLFDVLSAARTVTPNDIQVSVNALIDGSPTSLETPDPLHPSAPPLPHTFDIGRFDALVRQAGIADPFHPTRWFRRLTNFLRYKANYDPDDEAAHFDDTLYRKTEQVVFDLSVVGHFVRRIEEVGRQSRPSEFRDALLALIGDYGLVRTTYPPSPEDADAQREYSAWRAFLELLDEMTATFESLPLFRTPPTLPSPKLGEGRVGEAREFAEYLRQALSDSEHACYPPQPENGVSVLSLQQTIGLSFTDLFVAGLVEGELPRGKADDFFLAPAPDASESAGSRADWLLARDRFIFREMLMNAERAVLTVPLRHEGKDLSPSPFLEDVRALFSTPTLPSPIEGEGSLLRSSPSMGEGRVGVEIAPLTEAETAPILSAREALIRMGKQQDATGSVWLSLPNENVAVLLRIEESRQSLGKWSVYDGYLDASVPQIAEILTERAERGHSVTQLDDYAACPMAYFLRRVLRLRPLESLEAEIAPNIRGIVVHDILDSFFNQVGALIGREGFGLEDARRVMRDVAVNALRRYDAQYPNLYWEEEKRSLLAGLLSDEEPKGILLALLESEYSEPFRLMEEGYQRGKYCEIEFGEPNPSKPHFGRAVPAVRLPRLEGGEEILLHGRVDRVDLDPETGRYIVYDYKLGWYPSASDTLNGLKFQLPIYLEAVSGLEECREGVAAAFYSLRNPREVRPVSFIGDRDAVRVDGRRRGKGLLPSERFGGFQEYVRENVQAMDAHIRSGRFHVTVHDAQTAGCGRCDYRAVCRVNFSRQQGIRTEQACYAPKAYDDEDEKPEVEGKKSEVRSQNPEVRSQESGARNRNH